jgi:hypothetical protein
MVIFFSIAHFWIFFKFYVDFSLMHRKTYRERK